MRLIYSILICFATPVAAALAYWRGVRDPQRRERLADRFGRPDIAVRPGGIWVHAASMGEVQAGAALVRALLARYADRDVVLTTMTATGAARVKALFAGEPRVRHCYLPYDLPFAVRGFLDRIRPARLIILETELWPNLLLECQRRNIVVAIANARISPRTVDRYRRFASLFREPLRDVIVAAQSALDAERFKSLGARNVSVSGNIKFDLEIPTAIREQGAARRASWGERFIWVAGSTHEGEEAAAIAAHRELLARKSNALLILAPRHPQRFAFVEALLQQSGLKFITRASQAAMQRDTQVLLLDTVGELLVHFAAADLAFVGGSLVPVGGHNVLEPAALGVPVLCGPHMQNAQDVFDRLRAADGVRCVESSEELMTQVVRLSANDAERAQLGEAARMAVNENRGALERTLAAVTD